MPRTSPQYRVKALDDATVKVTIPATWSFDGDAETFTLHVRPSGGYVRRSLPNGDWRQICDRLYDTGPTLLWYPGGRSFAEYIRREVRRRKRDDDKAGGY